MYIFPKIVFIVVSINAIQTRPIIDLDASIVNGVFSIYFRDTPGINGVTFKVDYYTDTKLMYTTEVNITTPTDGYWIDGTNIEYSSLIFKFDLVEVNVTVRTGNDEITYFYTGCWNEIRNADCDVVELSTANGLAYYCNVINDYIFQDEFNTLSLSNWKPNIRHALYSINEEFVVYNNSEDNIYIKDNQLYIRPTIVGGNLRNGVIDFKDSCTSFVKNECELHINSWYKVLPPVSSALLSSEEGYTLKNICINVRAKLPKGDWLFPYISLQSSRFNYCFNVPIAFARGNEVLVDNTNADASGTVLLGGINVINSSGRRYTLYKSYINPKGQHFGNNFHNYTVCIDESDITYSVNNLIFGEIKISDLNSQLRTYVTRELFTISLGVSVGGHTNFVNISSKPWSDSSPNAALKFANDDKWQGTWRGEEMLIVDNVDVYKLKRKLYKKQL